MPLTAGTRLGPYEVVAPLGAGGMGEVYRARDTRLGREVAVKVLPQHLSSSPEVRARFEREARTVSSLNHPHICALFDVGREAGTDYLVMELVEGETLARRLDRGALPAADVLRFGAQIADALDRAHRAGVTHRDLKPGNIMLTRSGAKLMDFGLARATGLPQPAGESGFTQSPTAARPLTAEGTIVGTFQYMAPEQLEGRDADARSDLWALGCVLYEMATGRRAFEGTTQASLISAIMRDTPRRLSELSPLSPPALDRLVAALLAKDPDERVQTAHDVRLQLLWTAEAAPASSGQAAAAPRPVLRARAIPALVAVALVALGAFAAALLLPRRGGGEARTLTLLAPLGVGMERSTTDLAVSPDGSQVVFVGSDTLSGPRLWIRPLDRDLARPIENTDYAEFPFWSPDGRRVGFFAGGKLKTVDIASGSVRTLADAPLPRGAAWGRGAILFQPASLGPLWSVPEEGGEPSVATTLDTTAGDQGHRFPQFLPDQRHFILSVLGSGNNQIAVGRLGQRTVRKLFVVSNAGGATYAAPGWLIAPRDNVLKAQRFDSRTLRVEGPALELPGLPVVSPYGSGSPIVSASATGVLAERAALDLPQRLAIVDREGRTVSELAGPEGTYAKGTFSPDGQRAVFEYSHSGGVTNLWLADLARGAMEPLTFDGEDYSPVISPDGREIAYTRGSLQELWRMRLDEPASARLVAHLPNRFNSSQCWSPDGSGVLLRTQGLQTQQDLVFVTLRDSVRVRPVLATVFNEPQGSISPDGRWLAYVSDESGQYECRVRAFPSSEGQVQVVSRGAHAAVTAESRIGMPVWRHDGRELMYVASDGHTLVTVSVAPGDPPVFGEPKRLFRLSNAVIDLAASPGLDRFILSIVREEEGRSAATVVLNWTRLLESAK